MITALDENTALVLIDLQNGIMKQPLAHAVDDILLNVNHLITAFRKKALPVVVINVNPVGAAWTTSRKDSGATPRPSGNEWYQLSDQLKLSDGDVYITKHTWNAFFETTLHEELQKKSITGIVLAGISTSFGVEGTARAASELGYNISFATDAMTDGKEEGHLRSIQLIFPRMGETGTTEDIIKAL
ncbi:MAG: isochorismatase family protein [Ginsengibacter sp.]